MESRHVQGALVLCVFTQLWLQLGGQVPDCQQVRAAFHSLHPGSKWLPEAPLPGTDLQVCQSKGPTCCSRKMEERYQVAARGNMESALQAVSAQLKHLIIQNAAIFQEAFDLLLRHGRNATLAMLKSEFPALGGAAQSLVGQLFLDMSLYILGSDSTVDQMVTLLYSRLFPLTYRRLLAGSGAPLSEECVQQVWKESAAFGPYPKLMMTRLARSLLATRVFLQALNLGIEVVNTTDHLRPGRDCGRALLRLWYCPHCQGLLGPPLCRGLCQALMQGCLGGAAEVQPHWSTYVQGLAKLAGAMRGERDVEAVVLRLPSIIKLAIKRAVTSRSRLSALVSGKCGQAPQRPARALASPPLPPPAAVRNTQALHDSDETLAGLRRDFISNLRLFSSFYGGLGEALCRREAAPGNHSLCWNGLWAPVRSDRPLDLTPEATELQSPSSARSSTNSSTSTSCCGWWRCLRSAGEPGHEERRDGATTQTRASRAATATTRTSAAACPAWGRRRRRRDASAYASLQIWPTTWRWTTSPSRSSC
ncbi:glypican-3 isoform 2-T2 [Synchiropus picturatus]